ncbi:histone-lysine N-methyltransferase SMYD3-like isoform X1 [Macrobrachium nipponense]|uniref:histone-lysine N-methyltransferase SMYD3-like isoform X1 n=1 Tax=Macrobrachium nipponense TaxID=159736 RepID=UPI0030C7B2EA
MRDYYIRFQAKTLLNKRPISKGDLIMNSEPFAFVINSNHISEYCGYCLSRTTLLKPCKKCRFQWYCSPGCERLGWDFHKYECANLKRMQNEVPTSFVRLLARIIFKLQNGGGKIVEKYNGKDGRRFRDLMNHYADVKKDEEATKEVEDLIPKLKTYMGQDNLPNFADFLGIYGRVLVNRFCLFDDTMMTFGSGLYLAASIFDHACIPNCYISFSGRNVQIRSLIDMKELDYNKLRIGYVDPVCSVASRKADLYRRWFFWCDCKTCADKERKEIENSVICGTDGCDAKVYIPEEFDPENPYEPKCGVCETPVSAKRVRSYREIVFTTKKILKDMSEENPNLPDCVDLLEMQGEILHPLNVWRVRTLDFAFNACVFNGCWSRAMDYGDMNYEGMRYYYGAENPTFSLFLVKLGKAKIYLKEFREGVTHLEVAEPILTDALGAQHPIIVDHLISINNLANEDLSIRLERTEKMKMKEDLQNWVMSLARPQVRLNIKAA